MDILQDLWCFVFAQFVHKRNMKIQSNINNNIAPAVVSFLSDVGTPSCVFHRLSENEDTAFLFESTETDTRLARFSFIGIDPAKTIRLENGQATIVDRRIGKETTLAFENPLLVLSEVIREEPAFGNLPVGVSKLVGSLPFVGGLVGYLGYGATKYFEKIPQQKNDPQAVPEGYYGLYDSLVVFDHLTRRIHVLSYRGFDHVDMLSQRLLAGSELKPLFDLASNLSDSEIFEGIAGPFNQDQYVEAVHKCKEFINEGQVFQIVLAHRFGLPIKSEPLDVYRVLQAINPSPYAYYLKYPDFVYLGSSPETFVQCQDGEVVLRALAGTRPRGQTDAEDQALAQELRKNEKELAEHHMLVDLGRNDLGRICQPGTVRVGEIATLTKYAHVMHLATEVSGCLRNDKTCFDVVQSCFPRGTVSGAPKIRAMNLLSDLEPERRGIYSGVVGYFDFAGNTDGAIAIRSALIKNGQAHVSAGAGIVYDSDPVAEYEETRNKAKSVLKAIKMADKMNLARKTSTSVKEIC